MNEKTMTITTAAPAGAKLPHNVIIENRRALTATGIRAVLSYDSFTASLATEYGTLTIGGEGLSVSELSVQTGEVKIGGSIEYVQYTPEKEKREPLFKRLVR